MSGCQPARQPKVQHPDAADLYHGRWSIEELHKTSKALITEFHAKSVQGIRQELYAMFTLVALTRIFTNRYDSDIKGDAIDDQPDMRTNIRNGTLLPAPVQKTGNHVA